jgi:acyl-coenzyme A synthetase/AMP-(fatty) acid ligase
VRAALYAHQTAEVNAFLADLVDAKVLLVEAGAVGDLLTRRGEMPTVEHVVVYGGPPVADTLGYEEWIAAASPEDPRIVTKPDDLHLIRFSAGTTGRPKGVAHTVEGWLRSDDERVTPRIDERDVYLVVGRLTHAAAVFLWLMLQVGGRIVVVPAFDAGRALELIERERATFMLMVPTMIQAIVSHPEAATRDLSSL